MAVANRRTRCKHGITLFPLGIYELKLDLVSAARSFDPLLESRRLLSASDRQCAETLLALPPTADANLVTVAATYGHRDLRGEFTRKTKVVVAAQQVAIAHRASATIIQDQIRIVARLITRAHRYSFVARRDVVEPDIVIRLAVELALWVRRPISVRKESSVIGVAVEIAIASAQ